MIGINGHSSGFPAITDPTKQAEIYNYLEGLKKDENGWRKSVQSIATNSLSNSEECFLLLQVVEDYLQRRYVNASTADSQIVREFLVHWVKNVFDKNRDMPGFVINKMAHVFSMVFAVDFPEKWASFFQDLFFCQNLLDSKMAMFYLKVLLAIDSEVVDRDIQRSKQESDRNMKIKDAMREICINQIAQSWPTILNSVEDDSIQCLVLETIASYVDWIEVDLVANDTVMGLVISRLSRTATSEAATSAVCGLLQKGMPADKKVGLTLTLMSVFRANGLLTINESSDEDDVTRVGSLVNTLGLVLLDVHSKLVASSIMEEQQKQCVTELAALAQPAVAVLDNEDPGLSELPIDILKSYIAFLIKFYPDDTALLEKVIRVCLSRYVMSDDLNLDGEGEDEVEFQEYRKELRSLLFVIGNKRPEAIVMALEPWTVEVTSGRSQVPIRRVEALLHILFHLHEIVPSNMLQSPREGVSQRVARLPMVILEGLTLDGRSTTVHVTFFELACRYERLLTLQIPTHPHVIPQIAGAFLDQRGIAIPSSNVRTRIVYLFCRFVKAHKSVLSSLVSEVINQLAPLLAVSSEADGPLVLSSDDQAYLFEATATLIVFGNLTAELKAQYFGELASTLALKFEAALTELNSARARRADEETVQPILNFMSNIIIYCSRMSKAFNNAQSMESCSCVDIYLKLLKLFLDTLSPQNVYLLESTRQFAHRLVVSMEQQLMPYMGGLFQKLAQVSTDLDSMNQLLIFCHQAVAKFKKAMLSSGVDLGNVLAIAARASMQEQENITAAKDDSQRALIYVQRAFLQLLYTVIVSDCIEAVSATNGLLDHVLEAAARLALSTDQTSQKVALSCLSRIVQLYPSWSSRTLRIALEVPSLSHITASDAGSTIVVHEVCATLLSLLAADQNGFSQAIRELLPQTFSEQLLTALTTLKGKNLDKGVMNLYAAIRQRNV